MSLKNACAISFDVLVLSGKSSGHLEKRQTQMSICLKPSGLWGKLVKRSTCQNVKG